MERVAELRNRLRLQDIAKRIAAHEPRAKIANNLNIRPQVLEELIHSQEFIACLAEADTNAAEMLREEIESEEATDAEVAILDAQKKATNTLIHQMNHAEKDSDRRAAAIAIIELGRKITGDKATSNTKKYSFPTSQLDLLKTSAGEMDVQFEPDAEQSSRGL